MALLLLCAWAARLKWPKKFWQSMVSRWLILVLPRAKAVRVANPSQNQKGLTPSKGGRELMRYKKGEKLAEGKTKIIWAVVGSSDLVIVENKIDITAHD